MNTKKQFNRGFSIVELLVVIVIIGILAAITIVSYTGMQNRATVTSLKSDLNSAADLLRIDQAHSSTGVFPATLAVANGGSGVPASKNTTYQYTVNNTNTPKTFCLTATKSTQSYNINQEGIPFAGPCPVLWLDAGITTSYPGTGTTWNDLSGNGNNGTLVGGITYNNTNSGVMVFDGVNDYIDAGSGASLKIVGDMTLSSWIYLNHDLYPVGTTNWEVINSEIYQASGLIFRIDGASGKAYMRTSQVGTSTAVAATTALNVRNWYYITITKSGTNAKVYINGALNSTGVLNNPIIATSNLRIGGNGQKFDGLIGNVRLYNSALNPDEISQNFDALRSRYGI